MASVRYTITSISTQFPRYRVRCLCCVNVPQARLLHGGVCSPTIIQTSALPQRLTGPTLREIDWVTFTILAHTSVIFRHGQSITDHTCD